MYPKKKERLYISELLESPLLSYPSYYTLTPSMHTNEMLRSALMDLHMYHYEPYRIPQNHDEIFAMLHAGGFPLYKEQYIVGYFGNKMMILESHGWRAMAVSEDVFKLENWLVA